MVRARSPVQSRLLAPKMNKDEIQKKISEIENAMMQADFWNDKNLAQAKIREMQDLKDSLEGIGKYDKGNAVVTIFSGVGGDDAEDWTAILLNMYSKYAEKHNYLINFLYENKNDNGGYRTVTFEIAGKNAYGNLKHESGVHRLVRISPFNASAKRQTSFSMVEVIPQFDHNDDTVKISPDEIDVEFTKASGPGGQNVNKRETAVRVVHKATKLSAFVSNERSQAQNKEKALEILKGKLFALRKIEEEAKQSGMSISKTTSAEWGSQIRSYVMHPYKLVKDHRTKVETSDINGVLAGEIDMFIDSMKK